MIALIIVALLASGAGLGATPQPEAYAAVTTSVSTGERSIERAHGLPFEHGGVRRRAILRATAPAMSRVQTPGSAAGTDRPRAAALVAEPLRLALVMRRAAVPGAEVRRGHVPRPELPAHPSRAPPTV